MPLWILSALGWAKTALTAFLDLARRYPREAAIVALLCLSAWLWRGWDREEAHSAALIAASDKAAAEFQARIDADKAKFAKLKKDTDDAYKTALADAGDRTSRFIVTRRVRAETCSADQAARTGESAGAGLPEAGPAEALVAVSEADVSICAANYVYAQSAYEWARGLIEQGLGE